MLAIRPISCGPVRAPVSLHDTTNPHPCSTSSPAGRFTPSRPSCPDDQYGGPAQKKGSITERTSPLPGPASEALLNLVWAEDEEFGLYPWAALTTGPRRGELLGLRENGFGFVALDVRRPAAGELHRQAGQADRQAA